jgi:hypothetical protein
MTGGARCHISIISLLKDLALAGEALIYVTTQSIE